MSAGNFRHLLVLERPVLSPDGGGGFETAWTEVALIYAEVEENAGNEEVRAGKLAPVSPCRITIYHRADVTTDMRLTGGGRVYEILSLRDPDGRKAYLEIAARGETA